MNDAPATILVVDDDEFTAELTGMILEAAGYGVVIAVGGMEAMEKMAEDPAIRMVVSDMNMPFIDGVQLFAELREHGYHQPFVLLTGDEAGPLRIAHPDMDAVVTKDEDLQEALPKLVETIFSRG
jgi:CheY-like chemotaxis protein